MIVRKADHRSGTAVEVVRHHHDLGVFLGYALDVIPPAARHLDRSFNGLNTGVHRQDALHAGQCCKIPTEGANLVVVKGATGQREPIKLGARGLDQSRMPVAEVECGVGGQAVEVAVAVDVAHPASIAMRSDHWKRVVIVRRKCLGQFDLAGASRHCPSQGGLLSCVSRPTPWCRRTGSAVRQR